MPFSCSGNTATWQRDDFEVGKKKFKVTIVIESLDGTQITPAELQLVVTQVQNRLLLEEPQRIRS